MPSDFEVSDGHRLERWRDVGTDLADLLDEVLAERRHQSRTVSVIVNSLAVSVQQTLCHAPGGLHVADAASSCSLM